MKIVETVRAHLSRRVGPSFADMAIAANADYGYPDRWGTSPRRAPKATGHTPTPAKAYKPTHGGYPGEVEVQECVPTMLGTQNLPGACA